MILKKLARIAIISLMVPLIYLIAVDAVESTPKPTSYIEPEDIHVYQSFLSGAYYGIYIGRHSYRFTTIDDLHHSFKTYFSTYVEHQDQLETLDTIFTKWTNDNRENIMIYLLY